MACGQHGVLDRAHIRTMATARDGFKDETNLMQFCRRCHVMQGQVGWVKFIENHKHIMRILTEKNWEIREVLGVKKLCRK